MNNSSWRLRRLVIMALITALSYVAVALIRIPAVEFLSYEPKDVLLTIGAFMFGHIEGLIMAALVALLELVTISTTGPIGMAMNIVSSALFVCTAAYVYRRWRTLSGAVIGLLLSVVLMTGGMLLWNYLITPLYMGIPREAVAEMLLPMFLPFNLLKGGLNATLVMLMYKPVTGALRSARLLPPAETGKNKTNLTILLVSLFAFLTLGLLLLSWSGII